ncbi:MAG: SMC-Scp complex subunit ScpB [candidate division WOR-3 bacterium]
MKTLQLLQEFLTIKERFEKVFRRDSKRILEAILFCAHEPISPRRLALTLKMSEKEVERIVEELNWEYERDGHSFRIHKIVAGYQLYTLPEYAEWIKLFFTPKRPKLSKAAREILAIIAFKQPITKPEIEKIRGVDSTSTLHYLLERKLIKIAGRAKKLGAPFLYKTTKEFLKYFGLSKIEDLPSAEELDSFFQSAAPSEEKKEGSDGEDFPTR